MADVTATGIRGAADTPRRLSTILAAQAESASEPVTIGQIRDALGDRSFAALLVFFAALNLLPLPPGTTLILGLPMILVTAQMAVGQRTVWLPRSILQRSVGATRFRQITARILPRLLKFERMIRPRYWPFTSIATADRLIGIVGLGLSIIVTLPIPLGNWLPSFAVFLIALALSERDGIWLAIGLLTGLVSLILVTAIVGVAGVAAASIFS